MRQTLPELLAICRAFLGDVVVPNPCPVVVEGLVEPKFRRATFEGIKNLWVIYSFGTCSSREEDSVLQQAHEKDIAADRYRDIEGTLLLLNQDNNTCSFDLDNIWVGSAFNCDTRDNVLVFQGASTPFLVKPLGEMMIEGVGKQKV